MRKMAPCVRKMLPVGKAGASSQRFWILPWRNPREASLSHLVEHLAVELSLLPLTLHLGNLDHIPQQVEGQVDGERRLLAALQQLLRGPQRLVLFRLLAVNFRQQQVEAVRVPPLEQPQQVVAHQIRGGAFRGRPEKNIVHLLCLEAAGAIQPAGERAWSAGGGAEV